MASDRIEAIQVNDEAVLSESLEARIQFLNQQADMWFRAYDRVKWATVRRLSASTFRGSTEETLTGLGAMKVLTELGAAFREAEKKAAEEAGLDLKDRRRFPGW